MIKIPTTELPTHFCSVPWLQIHTEPDGKITPCCYYSHKAEHQLGNWNTDKLFDVFNSEQWNSLRKSFLDGSKPDACSRCWKEEDSGATSMRQRFNQRYMSFPDYTNQNGYDKFTDIYATGNTDGSVGDIKLATIDLIFNNLCNFKCRSCGPGLSTSWANDAVKMGNKIPVTLLTNDAIPHMTSDLFWLTQKVDAYTEVHFSGGEPMMQEEHFKFLQLLIDQGKTKVKIRYNTNMSVYKLKNYNAFEMLQYFDNVFIIGSIDAIGKQGEYIRKGANWEKTLEWIEISKQYLPNADYGISAVYSLLNAEAAIDLHKYMCESEIFTKPKGGKFSFYLNVLSEPQYMRATVLPAELKVHVTYKIKQHLDWLDRTQVKNFDYESYVSHWQDAMTLMNSKDETNLIKKFYKRTRQLDELRNERFAEIFPDLHGILKDYE